MINVEIIEKQLCESMCASVKVTPVSGGEFYVNTPFEFADGDTYAVYLKQLDTSGWRLSDKGATLMHLSYEMDIGNLFEGNREKIFNQILAELQVDNDQGELYMEFPSNDLGLKIFTFGQALTRVHDLNFLNRVQVENTFYEDLEAALHRHLGDEVIKNFQTNLPNSEAYIVDYAVMARTPLYIFGVSNKEKAKLATIILQYFQQQRHQFKSMVVYADMFAIPRNDLTRLVNASGDQIPSLNDEEDFKRKLTEAVKD